MVFIEEDLVIGLINALLNYISQLEEYHLTIF